MEIHEEENLIDRIFGEGEKLWKDKYRLDWCEMCRQWFICCPICKEISDSSLGTEECCKKDFAEFEKTNPRPFFHMTEEEIEVVLKFEQIKRHLRTCLLAGRNGLDWNWLSKEGDLSSNDLKTFNVPDLFEQNE